MSRVRDRMEELRAAGFKRLILDLRGVTFSDSTGIRLVLEVDASARSDGFDFALVEGPGERPAGLRDHGAARWVAVHRSTSRRGSSGIVTVGVRR